MPLSLGFQNYLDQGSGGAIVPLALGYQSTRLYVFDENGRISTSTGAGAVLEFPTTYTRGEAWELRFRSTYTASQFQGVYLQTRSDVANTSEIRAMELEARQGAAVALGGLTALHAKANVASSSTGNITTLRGAEIGFSMDDTYTGTVTSAYGLHVKVQTEDGATITTGYGVYIENEAVTGGERLTAAIGITATAGFTGYRYGIDSTGVEFTNGAAGEVVLWAFKGADGTTYYVKHDTDAATVLAVVTSDPTT